MELEDLQSKLTDICKEIEGAKVKGKKCILPAESGEIEIFVKSFAGYPSVIVKRKYKVRDTPWDSEENTIILQNVIDIEPHRSAKGIIGIIAENTDNETVNVYSYWMPASPSPHQHEKIHLFTGKAYAEID